MWKPTIARRKNWKSVRIQLQRLPRDFERFKNAEADPRRGRSPTQRKNIGNGRGDIVRRPRNLPTRSLHRLVGTATEIIT